MHGLKSFLFALLMGVATAQLAIAADPVDAARSPAVTLDPSHPDAGTFVALHEPSGTVAGTSSSCKTVGAYQIEFGGTFRYRGNAFRFEVDTRVLEIGMMLSFPSTAGSVSIQFSVHRLEDDGMYKSVLTEEIIRVVDGMDAPHMYTTGPFAQPLLLPGGFDYLIAVTWGAPDIDFALDSLAYPQPFSTGSVLGSVGFNGPGIPIDEELPFVSITTTGVYAMEICIQPERGACCANGFCLEEFEDDCTAVGSFFHGERVDCLEVACSFGACCTSCGGCVDGYTPEGCDAEGGVNHWPGVSCTEPLCPIVTGACCDRVTCTETCADECTGTYRGDGTTCNPNICGGACCTDFNCFGPVTPQGCDQPGEEYRGDGTVCALLGPNETCGSGGACCHSSYQDGCREQVDRALCTAAEGRTGAVYIGDGATCSETVMICFGGPTPGQECTHTIECGDNSICAPAEVRQCPDDNAVAACCLTDGTCINTTADYCSEDWVMGVFNVGSRCLEMGFACNPEACCFDDGSCEVWMPEACTAFAGVSATGVTACASDACRTAITGACCGGDAGVCDEISQLACEDQGGVFQGVDTDCTAPLDTCPGFGACCRPEGDCLDDVTEDECTVFTGDALNYQGDGVSCGDSGVACDARRVCCASTGACLVILPVDCTNIGGIVIDGVGSCIEQPCAARGACCRDDECSIELESDCTQFGGAYRGDDTTCAGTLCTLGACCHLDGTCDEGLVLFECDAVRDEFAPGFACDNIECLGRGACCTEDTCLDAVTETACMEAGGEYDGDGSLCRAGLCVVGACCDLTFEDGCALKTRQQCEFERGAYLGAGTDCESSDCTVGSCCGADAACQDRTVVSLCLGSAQFRSDVTCQTCDGRGACCVRGSNECQFIEREECIDQEDARYAGDAEVCTLDLCTEGACCLPDATCRDTLSRLTCERAGGEYQGSTISCGDDDVCGVTGACCNRISGTCADNVLEAACAFDWTEGVSCDALDPPCEPAPTGACCDGDACTIDNEITCDNSGRRFIGADVPCELNTCSQCSPTIVSSDPPDCALDARFPHAPDDAGVSLGWDAVLFTLDCEPPAVTPLSFSVSGVGAPTVSSVDFLGSGVYRVSLSDVIPLSQWTCIEFTANGQSVCLSHLPANANADLLSETADVSALIENLGDAAIPPLPTSQCDIDRSEECTPADVLGAIDLLNGSGMFNVWQGITLPGACPNSP